MKDVKMTRPERRERAREILSRLIGGETKEALAEEYDLTVNSIKQVNSGRNYPDVYRELTGKEPRSFRKLRTDTPDDEMIHRMHQMKATGHCNSGIAATTRIKLETVRQYMSGKRRKSIWDQYNNLHSDGLLYRPWGRATKPGGPRVVLNEAA